MPLEQLLARILKKMRSSLKKYVNAPGALTRVWKGYLNIKRGDPLTYQGRRCVVEDVKPDRITVRSNGERFEILDISL